MCFHWKKERTKHSFRASLLLLYEEFSFLTSHIHVGQLRFQHRTKKFHGRIIPWRLILLEIKEKNSFARSVTSFGFPTIFSGFLFPLQILSFSTTDRILPRYEYSIFIEVTFPGNFKRRNVKVCVCGKKNVEREDKRIVVSVFVTLLLATITSCIWKRRLAKIEESKCASFCSNLVEMFIAFWMDERTNWIPHFV